MRCPEAATYIHLVERGYVLESMNREIWDLNSAGLVLCSLGAKNEPLIAKIGFDEASDVRATGIPVHR